MALSTRSLRRGVLVGAAAVGRIERSDPIPPGVYWLDIIHQIAPNQVSTRDNFTFWLQANPGRVEILKTAEYAPDGTLTKEAFSFDFTWVDVPGRTWVLFEVFEPVNRWGNDTSLGIPTVAEQGRRTDESDTIQSPELEGIDWLAELEKKTNIPQWFLLAIAGGIVSVTVGILIRSYRK